METDAANPDVEQRGVRYVASPNGEETAFTSENETPLEAASVETEVAPSADISTDPLQAVSLFETIHLLICSYTILCWKIVIFRIEYGTATDSYIYLSGGYPN